MDKVPMLMARKDERARLSRPTSGPSEEMKCCRLSGSSAAGLMGWTAQHSLRYHSRYLRSFHT